MNISALFIRRAITTTLVMASVLIGGSLAYPLLPVSDLPNVDFPVITVSADLPGASPETMASSVATPLEKQFSTISGLESMSSVSALGTVQITLQFALDKNIDTAAQDVQSAIAWVTKKLPDDMPSPPSYRKINPADQPILYFALTSPSLAMSEVDKFAQNFLVPNMSMTEGVSQVQVYGSQKYAVRITVDPKKLSVLKVGIDEVQDAIQEANVNIPGGTLEGSSRAFTIEPKGQLLNADAYKKLIVAVRDGKPIRMEDIGEVYDSVENDKIAAWFCTKKTLNRAIILAVQKQPGSNTVKTAERILKLVPELQKAMPAAINMEILFDVSAVIKNSVNEVMFTMILTLFLVVIVIYIFLRNLRATLIPSLSLPMSIIGTFIVMYLLDYSLDNLSLMALTLSIGFVVDDAIVALENIFRHYESGKSPMQAALDGSGEIAFTIVSMTLSLSAVFIPILFMGGIVGRLFREFSVTIGAAVLVSGAVALTLIPMLGSKLISKKVAVAMEKTESLSRKGVWQSITKFYERTLRWNLKNTWLTAVVSIAVIMLTVYLFKAIPKGFLPDQDMNRINISTEAEQGISFEALKQRQMELTKIIQEIPEVEAFMSRCGGSGQTSASNTGSMFIRLVSRDERKKSAVDIVPEIRKKLSTVPGIKVFVQNPPSIQIGARSSKSQYQYSLVGADTEVLYKFGVVAERELLGIPELVDVTSDLLMSKPQLNLEIDRDQASKLGITASQIENALYSSYGSRQISTIFAPDDQYSVLMEVMREKRSDPDAISMLYVRNSDKQLVPIDSLLKKKLVAGPFAVNHTGQLPSVTLSFNLKEGVALGDAVAAIQAKLAPQMPAGVAGSFQGTAQAFQKSMKGLDLLLLLTIAVIYIVLGILYESYIHPITILTALPFAGFGALLSLMIVNIPLTIYAFIGLILLIGIVKKNGIMMVDFAIQEQQSGASPEEAIIKASTIRFRPIMMTTLTALMAGIPLAVSSGLGSESRRPLGVTVVGGLLFSQLLPLYVTPVFFVWMEKIRSFIISRHKDEETIQPPPRSLSPS